MNQSSKTVQANKAAWTLVLVFGIFFEFHAIGQKDTVSVWRRQQLIDETVCWTIDTLVTFKICNHHGQTREIASRAQFSFDNNNSLLIIKRFNDEKDLSESYYFKNDEIILKVFDTEEGDIGLKPYPRIDYASFRGFDGPFLQSAMKLKMSLKEAGAW